MLPNPRRLLATLLVAFVSTASSARADLLGRFLDLIAPIHEEECYVHEGIHAPVEYFGYEDEHWHEGDEVTYLIEELPREIDRRLRELREQPEELWRPHPRARRPGDSIPRGRKRATRKREQRPLPSPKVARETKRKSSPKIVKRAPTPKPKPKMESKPEPKPKPAPEPEPLPDPPADEPLDPDPPIVKPSNHRYGIPVPGREGMVYSPHTTGNKHVDVRGIPTGTLVKDPYTGKLFRVP